MSRSAIPFLVEFDRTTGAVNVTRFVEDDAALAALHEREAVKASHEEVVLFYSDSEETLRLTHSRYFYTADELIERLRDNLPTMRPAAPAAGA